MPTRSLQVVITGDSRQLGVASRQADAHLTFVEKSAKRMGTAVKAGFGVAAIGAGIGIKFLKDSVRAAEEAETSQKRLEAQLKASGISYRAHAKQIDEVIQRHSKLAAVDDEDLQDAFTTLVRATGHVNQSLREMGLVTDIARARHISLTKAADLLGKVHAGNVGILKRFGVAIQPVTAAQDKLRESTKHATVEQVRAAKAADATKTSQRALGELQKRFGGQAEAYGKTAAGAQDRFRVAVENLQEKIGKALLPVITKVTNAVSKFVDQMTTGRGAGGRFAKSITDVHDALAPIIGTGARVISFLSRYKAVVGAARDVALPFINAMKLLNTTLNAVKDAANAVAHAVGAIGGAAKSVAGAIGGVVGKLNPFGDGLGKLASGAEELPSGGAFGGSLMGAQAALKPFAAVGSQFGLHVSSGRRPGSITSSGNVSYHSSGEAIDMADGRGPDTNKMGFFQYMKSHFGGRLAELIYGPGQVGVKNGQPYNFGSALNAQHMDHVHVALDTGRPGVGDGLGRRGKGDGLGFDAVARLAESVGLPGVTFAQIAHGESGYNPRAIGHDPGGTLGLGLWQITTKYNDDIIAKYGGQRAMLNPRTNALAARDVWRRQGKGAWYGTKYVTDWNAHYKASSGGGSGGGGGGGGSSAGMTPAQRQRQAAAKAGGQHASGVSGARQEFASLTLPGGGGYGQHVADAQLGEAGARSKDNLKGLIKALNTELGLKRKRLAKIRKTLKRRLKAATRKALTEEATTLVGEIGDLQDTLKEYRADQKAGATTVTRAEQLDAGVDTNAASTAGAGGAGSEGGGGDPNQALIDALAADAAARQALADQLTTNTAELKRQTDFATNVANTSNFQLTKSISDLIGGRIVGYGVAGRAFTPGTGVEYAY